MGQTGIDLDGDTAVDEVGGLGDLAEDVGGVAHIGGGELADGGLDIDLAELLELGVVRADLAQGLLEDGRVGGDADHVLVGDEVLQGAGLDAGAGQVVQPDGNAVVGRALSCFSHVYSPYIPYWNKSVGQTPAICGVCGTADGPGPSMTGHAGGPGPSVIRSSPAVETDDSTRQRETHDHLAASASAMEALAASTTCSAVMPRSIMF